MAEVFGPGALRRLSDEDLVRLLDQVKGNPDVPRRAFPVAPTWNSTVPVRARLHAVQQFIKALEYNHTGTSYFRMYRDRGIKHVMLTAKEIIREALPIQCVEAVFVALYLTNGITELNRFPISFKSKSCGHTYRHIVLAVQLNGKWGALGISRRASLMFKEVTFASLSALVAEYRTSYQACHHDLVKLYIGLPFLHDAHADGPIKWRAFKTSLVDRPWSQVGPAIDKFGRDGPRMSDYFQRMGSLPNLRQTTKARRSLSSPSNRAPVEEECDSSGEESAEHTAADSS